MKIKIFNVFFERKILLFVCFFKKKLVYFFNILINIRETPRKMEAYIHHLNDINLIKKSSLILKSTFLLLESDQRTTFSPLLFF
jgi:hypothetical protein